VSHARTDAVLAPPVLLHWHRRCDGRQLRGRAARRRRSGRRAAARDLVANQLPLSSERASGGIGFLANVGSTTVYDLHSLAVRRDRLWAAILVVGGLLALAALVLGALIGFDEDWDSTGERVLWFVLTIGGALLLAAGLWYASRSRTRAAAVLISIGALMAGGAIFWSIVMPVAAIVVVVLTTMWVRRPAIAG
jgi:hypothetical protein